MSWPKQFVTVWGVRIATEDFVKNREEILKRLQKDKPKQEPWQMMQKHIQVNIAQKKFEEELKAVELKEEKHEEIPVPTVWISQTSDVQDTDLTQPKVEKKKVPVSKKKWGK